MRNTLSRVGAILTLTLTAVGISVILIGIARPPVKLPITANNTRLEEVEKTIVELRDATAKLKRLMDKACTDGILDPTECARQGR